MHRSHIVLSAILLAACTQSPEQKQATEVEQRADAQADALKRDASLRAGMLENQAGALANEADRAGGFEGQKLDTRADALKQEARIVEQQGDARADAVESQGEATAKAIRSR